MKEPSRAPELAKYTAAAAVVIGLVIGVALFLNRGSNVRLEGKILKVRAIPTGDAASLALVDFRLSNPANTRFIVRDVRVTITKEDGTTQDGMVAAQGDLDRVIGYFPAYGPRYNEVLRARSQLAGGAGADWCTGAGFDFPAPEFEKRRNLKITIEDVDGALVELNER